MKQLIFLLAFTGLLIACSSNPSDTNAEKDATTEAIAELEAKYSADPSSARSVIGPLLAKYEEYVASPEGKDSMKVVYLLRAGEMAGLLNQYGKSLSYYEKILSDFPNSAKAPTALFMKGYTLDAKLKQLDDARAVYEAFLQKYPNDDFADDTQFLLNNLGKSDEEIIKQFEKAEGK